MLRPEKIKKAFLVFAGVFFAAGLFGAAGVVLAQDIGLNYAANIGLTNTTQDLRELAVNIVRFLLTFLGIAAVAMIIYGGFVWTTSGGEPARIDKAKRIIVSALIGLVIIIGAFVIVTFVIDFTEERLSGQCTPACVSPIGKCCPGNYCCGDTDNCCGGGCCAAGNFCCAGVCQATPCGTPPVSSLELKYTSPRDNQANVIRNAKIRLTFNTPLDPLTVIADNIRVLASTSAPIAGALDQSGQRVVFTPAAGCGDNPCGASHCFAGGETVTVEVEGVRSASGGLTLAGMIDPASGLLVSCGSAGSPCRFDFAVGDLIDCDDPRVVLDAGQLCADVINDVYASSSDAAGIDRLEFFLNGARFDTVNNPAADQSFNTRTEMMPASFDADPFAPGDTVNLRVAAYDIDDHAGAAARTVTLYPDHCCNAAMDGDETGVNCGGSCAACRGAACAVSMLGGCADDPDVNCDPTRCASGFCHCGDYPNAQDSETCQQKGYDGSVGGRCCVCETSPVIDWISPAGGFCTDNSDTFCRTDADCPASDTCDTKTPNGRAGNLITIGGRNFGTTTGRVYFSQGNPTPDLPARLAETDNSYCAPSWSDTQIVAVVPVGAITGPVRVEERSTGFNYFDDTNGNFFINAITRPGLCSTTPDRALAGATVTYRGLRLGNNTAYFGTYTASSAAPDPSFPAAAPDNTGTAAVPLIHPGRVTTFTLNPAFIPSNYLYFYKEREIPAGPRIISFEPLTGAPGTYVTIRGQGFGPVQGASRVFFGDEVSGYEANDPFPRVCADEVWSDNQVIVKVPATAPNVDYPLTILVNGRIAINTSGLTPPEFDIDNTSPPKPSLCALRPKAGPALSPVSLWGEYFGAATGSVRFSPGVDQGPASISFWGTDGDAQRIDTAVHLSAITGPVRAVDAAAQAGNGINFRVGDCAGDADCGAGNICCPENTGEAGRCAASLDACYRSFAPAVLEWEFTTRPSGGNLNDPCYDPASTICTDISLDECNPGLFCDPLSLNPLGQCTCQPISAPGFSCEEIGARYGICPIGFCPNSPGRCSLDSGATSTITGTCDDSCAGYADCASATCVFDGASDRCVKEDIECATTTFDGLGATTTAYCASHLGRNRFHIDTSVSCPAGWTNIGGGRCADLSSDCALCGAGFACRDYDRDGDYDCAATAELCPGAAVCSGTDCELSGRTVCECCCEVAFPDRDCCRPLRCEGECGTGDPAYGNCSGCRVDSDGDGVIAPAEQALSDEACNCEGHKGKYCDVGAGLDADLDGYPDGVCRDCSYLEGRADACTLTTTCCFDANGGRDRCRGLGANEVLTDLGIDYCAYYECATTTPYDRCLGQFKEGSYATSTCNNECLGPRTPPGNSCFDESSDTCSLACAPSTECLGADGCRDNLAVGGCGTDPNNLQDCRCCCNPAEDKCPAPLSCWAGRGDCTGTNRGLCCGCTDDDECAPQGCGSDTCCHDRPAASGEMPADETRGVCRNPLVAVEFDRPMDITSFLNNFILVGDYGTGLCPGDTEYLGLGPAPRGFTKFVYKLKIIAQKFLGWLYPPARAYWGPIDPSHNFCAVSGRIEGGQTAAGHGMLYFYPARVLDPDRAYYGIVLGDPDLTNNTSEGARSSVGLGLAGGDTATLSGRLFENAHIFSFETGSDVCALARVDLKPESYVFTSSLNNTGGLDDDNPVSAAFDTNDGDRDKVFYAYPVATNGQVISPVSGQYAWRWSWQSANETVAAVANTDQPAQVVVAGNRTDAETVISAMATVVTDEINDGVIRPKTTGRAYTGRANVYVIECENLWPPRDPAGNWEPWQDIGGNCSTGLWGAGCDINNNVKFYYCRDSGGPGTADDLPAILSGESIVIRGKSSGYACSDGSGTCPGPVGSSCGAGGTCQYGLLKEFYFLREETPSVAGAGLVVTDALTGGRVRAQWSADPAADGYKLYWGTRSRGYADYAEISPTGATGLSVLGCGVASGIVTCELGGLADGTAHYFAYTVFYDTGAESEYSEEAAATPSDQTPPPVPAPVVAAAGDGQVYLRWATSSDAVSYSVYYGTFSGSYGEAQNVGNTSEAIISSLPNGTPHYFTVTATDRAGNRSPYAGEATATPDSSVSLTLPAGDVILVWDTGGFGGEYMIYYEVIP